MALTVPDFTPAVQCTVAVAIVDANFQATVQLAPDQINTLTDEQLDTMVDDLADAMAAFCPGMQVQTAVLWGSNATAGSWQTVEPGT